MKTANQARCYFTIAIMLWIAHFGCPNDEFPSAIKASHGVRFLKQIRDAEETVHSRTGHYCDLNSLGPAGQGLIPQDLAIGQSPDYEYHLELTSRGYFVTASPVVRGRVGVPFFYCDETGVIRENYGSAANKDSPSIDGSSQPQ